MTAQEPSPRNTYRLMAGMACAAIVLIGVAIYSLSQIQSPLTTRQLRSPVLQATLRQNLPAFEYTADGIHLRPENFKGRWTLLSFWAHWCTPCLEEMPSLHRLFQQWQGHP